LPPSDTRHLEEADGISFRNGSPDQYLLCSVRLLRNQLHSTGPKKEWYPVGSGLLQKEILYRRSDHPAFDLLVQERQRLYGKPEEIQRTHPVSPCEYHDPRTGCLLKTHKSPTCLSFLCSEAIAKLRNVYGIYAYDYLGVYYALEWILTGNLSDHHFYAFRESILDMTMKVKEAKRFKHDP
jgi:hypothetical protein